MGIILQHLSFARFNFLSRPSHRVLTTSLCALVVYPVAGEDRSDDDIERSVLSMGDDPLVHGNCPYCGNSGCGGNCGATGGG